VFPLCFIRGLTLRGGLSPLAYLAAFCSFLGLVSAQEPVADTPVAKIAIDTTPIAEAPITSADRSHWSFQPIRRPKLPAIHHSSFSIHNSIDVFILDKLAAKQLTPQPEAPRHTLLRRVSFDLTGLPPTPAELTAFEADPSPDGYERVTDRLLASPAFGERYGQYWLDLARFAETDGYEHDKVRPQAWKYRDFVVAALNCDLPYDEFIRQQLAGDEGSGFGGQGSEGKKQKSDVATMFCLSGGDMPDINDQAERRHNLLNEMTATVGSVFLGLQLGCAQCHNHKYDPLSQADFYRLRAVFEPAVPLLKRDAPYNVLANQKEPPVSRFWVRGDHKRPGLEVQPDFPRIASTPERGTRSAERGAEKTGLSSALRAPRSALSDWLVAPDNPLTSRVIANRLWQFHFGRGICTTPSDFGVMGAQPTHPELLDYLATDLRDHGWGLKRLNRLIVSSATYRQRSNAELGARSAEQETTASVPRSIDPENSLYWAFPRQRLNGEAIRDAMLSAAGLLSADWQGQSVMPPLPEELLSTLLKGQWSTSKREADHYKRSIYVFARRNLRYPIFEAFDRPDGNASCPIRNKSTTAPQSLLLFNSEFSLLASRHLAGRVLSSDEAGSDRKTQIDRLYMIALSRHPSAAETQALETFLNNQQKRLTSEGREKKELALPITQGIATDSYADAALVDTCLAILNSSEFLYVD
jgi:hypothetical protein